MYVNLRVRMRMFKRIAVTIALLLATFGIGAALASMPAGAQGLSCQEEVVNPTALFTQGPSPTRGQNAWRLTNIQGIRSHTCGGVWMESVVSGGSPSCGFFFASRVTRGALDWNSTAVCTNQVQIVHTCDTCNMRYPDAFNIWQEAIPFQSPRADSFVLWA